jgi:hypothetical protein
MKKIISYTLKLKINVLKSSLSLSLKKNKAYTTHLNLVYYDYKEKQGYYATMTETTEESSDAFD